MLLRKPHILFVLPSLQVGGAEIHSIHQLNYLYSMGYNLHLIVLGSCEGALISPDAGIKNVTYLNWKYVYIKTASVVGFFSVARQLFRYIKQHHVTHVFAHLPISHYIMRWVKLWQKLTFSPSFELITYHHSLVYEHSPTNTASKYLFNLFNSCMAYWFDNMAICVSEAVKQNIAKRLYLRNPKVLYNAVPYSGVNSHAALQYCHNNNIKLPDYLILFPASLKLVKGHLLFIEAFAEVVEQLQVTPAQLKVVLAGSGELENTIKEQLRAKKMVDFFVFTGTMPNVLLLSFMKLCRLVVIPSLSEGLPMVAIEALMQEQTVLCSDAGGLPEVFTDGETGYIFPKGKKQALAQKLLFLIQNPNLLSKELLANYYRQHFTFESHIRKLLAISGLE